MRSDRAAAGLPRNRSMRAYVSAAFCSINTVTCYPSAQIEGVVAAQARRAVTHRHPRPAMAPPGGARQGCLPPDLLSPSLTH